MNTEIKLICGMILLSSFTLSAMESAAATLEQSAKTSTSTGHGSSTPTEGQKAGIAFERALRSGDLPSINAALKGIADINHEELLDRK